MSEEQINEVTVRRRLHQMLSTSGSMQGSNVVGVGNYPHEIDFMRLMDSGYVHAYEIKCSVSDLRKELKKPVHKDLADGVPNRRVGNYGRKPHPIRTYTVVVVSQKMVDEALRILPSWAGIIYIGHWEQRKNEVVRKARALENSRVLTEIEKSKWLTKFYYRYWALDHDYQLQSARIRALEGA